MTRPTWFPVLIASTFALSLCSSTFGDGPEPYSLGIEIVFGDDHGEEDLRRQMETTLLAALETEGCFRRAWIVAVDAPDETREPADLLLRIVLTEFNEKSEFGVNLAQLTSPNREPGTDQKVVVETEGVFDVELLTQPERRLLRRRQFGDLAAYTPRMNEDPRVASWDKLIASAVRTTRRFVCRGSIEKDIRRSAR